MWQTQTSGNASEGTMSVSRKRKRKRKRQRAGPTWGGRPDWAPGALLMEGREKELGVTGCLDRLGGQGRESQGAT